MGAIEQLFQPPVAQAIGWALLQFVWQGALVGIISALALLALRRSAADVRYVVATIGLALMLTMPAVTAVQTWRSIAMTDVGGSADVESWTASHVQSEPKPVESAPKFGRNITQVEPAARSAGDDRATWTAGSDSWIQVVLAVWLTGVALLTIRLLIGWAWVQRLKSRGIGAAANEWQQAALRLSKRLHISRTIRFFESTLVEVPTVIGWLRPVVLMPASALAGMTPQQIEAILAHELAHIRRHDYVVNLLQTLVEKLLFNHPAGWWVSRRIRTVVVQGSAALHPSSSLPAS